MYKLVLALAMAVTIAVSTTSYASKRNPVVVQNSNVVSGSTKVSNHLGHGRKAIVNISTKGNDLVAAVRFENHHRSRGWTLCTTVTLVANDGKVLVSQTTQRGIKAKGWRGYRVKNASITFAGAANKVASVSVKSWRCATKRAGREAAKNVYKYRKVLGAMFGYKIP